MKNSIAKEVKEEILARVKAGEPVLALSKQYGVSDKSIYNWIRGKTINKISWLEFAKLRKKTSN